MESESSTTGLRAARSRRIGLAIGGAVVLSIAAWSLYAYSVRHGAEPLPVLGRVPSFSLVASDGRTVSQADFQGQVWVADFIFTRCAGVCPILSDRMARVQDRLTPADRGTVHLVSFSVDPKHDTPETLREYGKRFGADPSLWTFLTGERDRLYTLIRDGFHLAVVDPSEEGAEDTGEIITHSDRFVLVDRDLRIRAYYHGMEAESVERILRDVAVLRAERAG